MKINIDLIYPIGSIYLTTSTVNPSTLFGGTWVRWGNGRVPVGVDSSQSEFDSVEKTGGSKTHKLTAQEMPKHYIETYVYNFLGQTGGKGPSYTAAINNASMLYNYADGVDNVSTVTFANLVGGDQPHNNLQPYITCYMWKRTA